MKRRHWLELTALGTAGTLAGCRKIEKIDQVTYAAEIRGVIKQHAEVCYAAYKTAWQKADMLRGKTSLFLAQPNASSHAVLRETWNAAHAAYMETEALRGVGTPVDGIHPNVAAWPIDPAALDTVPGNVKAGIVHDINGIPNITAEAVKAGHQPRVNKVLTGFHAIEFLIYGVDLYDDAGGARLYTDYTVTIGFERRRELLGVLTRLLSDELAILSAAWHPSQQGNFRGQYMEQEPERALTTIFTGVITVCNNGLSGALARPLASSDQKDEICQFSDTSLEAIRHAVIGLQNVLLGKAPGRVLEEDTVPMIGLIAKADASIAKEIETGIAQILAKLGTLDQPFDQMIRKGHSGRKPLEEVATSLADQGKLLSKVGTAVGAKLGSLA